ncbi:Short coiled-coil protein B-like [Homarus americanus]|uniref:Short coiled-coil protein B-like n=1 Tax=Homarus americanus TaxID=6706 RepID=A0A8J5N558_HOMAM|nr:Short coiled-coil protein B-like [Homarus americanus]
MSNYQDDNSIPLVDDDPSVVLDDDRTGASEISDSTRGQSLESIPSAYTNGSNSPLHNSLEPDMSPDEQEEKARLIAQVLELQNTLDDALFLIASAWKEVTMRCLCAAWRPLWPECVLQRDFEGFEELEEEAVVHEIVSLGNSMGLEVDDDDVEELVEEYSKELSTEELLELHKEENETLKRSLTSEESGEDEDKEESRIIPAKDLKDVFFRWSKLSKLAEDYHPDVGSVEKGINLSQRVDSVKEENLKLRSENQVLGQYIENLMSASSVFQSTSPKTKKNKQWRQFEA